MFRFLKHTKLIPLSTPGTWQTADSGELKHNNNNSLVPICIMRFFFDFIIKRLSKNHLRKNV